MVTSIKQILRTEYGILNASSIYVYPHHLRMTIVYFTVHAYIVLQGNDFSLLNLSGPGVDFTKGFKTWHKFSTEIRFMLIPIIVLFIAHEFITGNV